MGLKFLNELPINVDVLESRVTFDCSPYGSRHYVLSQRSEDQQVISFTRPN